MKNEKAIIRSRNWFLVSYLTMEEITNYCKLGFIHGIIKHYAFIKHDCDVGKEPHIHLLVVYKNARTASAVKADFAGYTQNTLVEVCSELDSAYDYLTHKRNADKYQYDRTLIVCDNVGYWEQTACGNEPNTAEELIYDIIRGCSPREMLHKYGRDYVLNYARYHDFAQMIYDDVKHCTTPQQRYLGNVVEEDNCPFMEDKL